MKRWLITVLLCVLAVSTTRAVPGPPLSFFAFVAGNTVFLQWTAAPGFVTTYRLEAGTAPGLANIGPFDVGVVTSLTVAAPPGTYYARVRAVSVDGVSAPSNEIVVVVGSAAPPPPGPPVTFGPGQHRVGIDIAPGRYYSVPSVPMYGCYWERQRGFSGTLPDIIANEFIGFNAGQWIVDIRSTGAAFETDPDCGTWFNTPRRGTLSFIEPGLWLVGSQVSASTYRAFVSYECYWARLRNFTGELSGIIANDFVSTAGNRTVAIAASDLGFQTDDDCGYWLRSSDLLDDEVSILTPSITDIEHNRRLRWHWMHQR